MKNKVDKKNLPKKSSGVEFRKQVARINHFEELKRGGFSF